jgi:hypothetical protein
MPEDGPGEQELFRQWQEMSRGFLDDGGVAEPLRERCEALFAAWGRFARTWAEAAGAKSAGDLPGQPGGPFDPASWMDAGGAGGWGDLWRWFGASEGADFWQAERDLLRASQEWTAYARALERYKAVMTAAWLRAFGRFTQGLAGGTPQAALPDWSAMQTRWQAVADAELAAAQGSEEFLDAQRELIRARLACAALLRSRIDGLAQLLGLPTRAELDALHESVHRMGRDLRALRARLDAVDPEDGGESGG